MPTLAGTHWTPSEINKYKNKFPKTRKELLYYLWFGLGMNHVNIFKEGPEYAIRIGNKIHATYLRTIDSLTFGGWAERCRKEYFPF